MDILKTNIRTIAQALSAVGATSATVGYSGNWGIGLPIVRGRTRMFHMPFCVATHSREENE
jgi:hypothetical protein